MDGGGGGGFAEYFVAINGDEEEEEPTRQRLSSDRGIKSFVNVDDDSASNYVKHSINDHLHHRDSYSGKLFVGGVAWETTEETFSNYFCKYGEITDSVIMLDKLTGRSRGFGFVTFADPAVADKVLEEDHVIDGRVVEVKRTVPRADMQMQVKREQKTKKIFVGGIPPSLTEDELKEYFSSYGSITEHQIMLDHNTGRSRGFGFVTFDDEETVERIFSNGQTHELGGKQVEIKKAVPKRAGSDYGSDVRMHHGGRASKSYGGFSNGAAEYGGGGYNGKMRDGGYGGAYGGYGGGYGSYEGNYGGGAAGFYGGYGGYGYGFGFWGPMYNSGGYGGTGYGTPGGYGAGAGYGGGGKGYGGSGGGKGYGIAGSATGRYHPYQK
ncbi:Heterogeneous nuclear ribonucleoprotein 1 [Camellia lanceoleosa]|uniref:Heterogeneous nuclear ribonucleoprotein 1 n=1 Tax=Camellia lanceoleosa TaxID=1840588 RepID=A0ACC0FF78_9ERIC|nr:Heterogeneous nuclear ribonucleoprotein 1 [Camellia lanceoleosa]